MTCGLSLQREEGAVEDEKAQLPAWDELSRFHKAASLTAPCGLGGSRECSWTRCSHPRDRSGDAGGDPAASSHDTRHASRAQGPLKARSITASADFP